MPVVAIAELDARVKHLEEDAKVLRQISKQLAGVVATVQALDAKVTDPTDGLKTVVEDLKDGLKTTVDGLKAAVEDPTDGLKAMVNGLKTAVENPQNGLETRVAELRIAVDSLRDQGGTEVDRSSGQQPLSDRVSSIEGHMKMAMWLVPVVMTAIALILQVAIP